MSTWSGQQSVRADITLPSISRALTATRQTQPFFAQRLDIQQNGNEV